MLWETFEVVKLWLTNENLVVGTSSGDVARNNWNRLPDFHTAIRQLRTFFLGRRGGKECKGQKRNNRSVAHFVGSELDLLV
jgi:hypothetical protein